jgi:hypothetical protein
VFTAVKIEFEVLKIFKPENGGSTVPPNVVIPPPH